jgi:Raf kinase inhibitor-like YbhB/YbcL family protein
VPPAELLKAASGRKPLAAEVLGRDEKKLPSGPFLPALESRNCLLWLRTMQRGVAARQGDEIQLTSPAFAQGGSIPKRYTCDGDNISPALSWKDAPKETKSLVLILHDPDVPARNAFTHWLLYNIPPNVSRIEENVPGQPEVAGLGLQGRNDAGKIGYMGPCPPLGRHHYFFHLYSLRRVLNLEPGAAISR